MLLNVAININIANRSNTKAPSIVESWAKQIYLSPDLITSEKDEEMMTDEYEIDCEEEEKEEDESSEEETTSHELSADLLTDE